MLKHCGLQEVKAAIKKSKDKICVIFLTKFIKKFLELERERVEDVVPAAGLEPARAIKLHGF